MRFGIESRLDTAAKVLGKDTQQVEDLPEDRFCGLGEIEDCPWKVNRQREDDDSDDEDGYGTSPRKRARDGGNHRLPRVSTDYDVDMDTLLDEIGDSCCPISLWFGTKVNILATKVQRFFQYSHYSYSSFYGMYRRT